MTAFGDTDFILRIAKKLNYKSPFLKIAVPSMFFLADQMMEVFYHDLPMESVVRAVFNLLFLISCIGYIYTIQLRRMVSISSTSL